MRPPENLPNLVKTCALPQLPSSEQTHILLVDDDDTIRTIIRFCLEKLGYLVSCADGGNNALEAAAQNKDIQLLLTDVLMPGVSGAELAEKLRKTHPRLEVLYVSGHSRATISKRDLPVDAIHFLQKPFTSAQLDTRIKAILSKRNQL